MDSRAWLDLAEHCAAILAGLAACLVSLRTLVVAREVRTQQQELHVSINSRLDQFLAQAQQLGFAEGQAAQVPPRSQGVPS